MLDLTDHAKGSILGVRAQPGARRSAIVGEHGGALKVAVTAAPERGKANDAIIELLSEALGCAAGRITLITGASSRGKRFAIEGLSAAEVLERLGPWLKSTPGRA